MFQEKRERGNIGNRGSETINGARTSGVAQRREKQQMKITCDRSRLAEALGIAGRAVSSRNTLPILANVLLETEEGRLRLTATDLDTAIRCVVPAKIAENGATAVPAHLLSDVVSKLPDASVTIEHHPNAELTGGLVSVRCGKSEYTILSLPAEDYPAVPKVTEGVEFSLSQGTLKEMLQMTTFAAVKEETRSLLMGVLFEAHGNHLTLVATDTHRLAKKEAAIGTEIETPVSAVIPAKPLIELQRLLKDNDTPVTIRIAGSQVQFETGSVLLVSRLIDAQFPNYQKVIPDKADRVFTVRREEFVSALGRVNIVAQKAYEKVVFNVEYGTMELTAESPDVGKAFEELEASVDGEGLRFAINGRYLAEALGVISGRDVTLSMTGALNPGILRSSDDDGFLYIVMPMQV